ncbi:MAG: Endolytic murein transglycosylase [Legionellaceae bacterium]
MLSPVRKLIGFILFLSISFMGWLTYDWLNFIRQPLIPANKLSIDYIFEPHSSVFVLAEDLKKMGLLKHPIYFIALAKWTQLSQHLQAGEYRFLPGIKPLQLLDQLAKGKVLSHQLTIVEGWTFSTMLAVIRKEAKIKHTLDYMPAEIIMAKLASTLTAAEGLFFPDTYRYTRGTSDFAIIQAAYRAMQKRLDYEWNHRALDLPYRSSYEALIVASLIEKETHLTQERPLIASVIINRLKKNMRLQIDPTIIYGIGENYRGKLQSSDLKKDTPYNTYLHLGLPPTPIALPGIASIRAALHPNQTNYLYFVAKGDGGHQFSATLNEHIKAVQNYIHYKQSLLKITTSEKKMN